MVSKEELERIVHSAHSDPFQVLGAHLVKGGNKEYVAVRAFLPEAAEVSVVEMDGGQQIYPAKRIHKEGLFEAIVRNRDEVFPYRLRKKDTSGTVSEFKDPYSFLPVLSEFDLYLMAEGTHHTQYEKLGAHKMVVQGTEGVLFAVWAPNAIRVSVVGDFNQWDGRRHMMRVRGATGIWEIFIPGLREGTRYKFEIKSRFKGFIAQKADPYAFYSEVRPKSASVVWNVDLYKWSDKEWMQAREKRNWFESPMSIYEVHLGSWRRDPR